MAQVRIGQRSGECAQMVKGRLLMLRRQRVLLLLIKRCQQVMGLPENRNELDGFGQRQRSLQRAFGLIKQPTCLIATRLGDLEQRPIDRQMALLGFGQRLRDPVNALGPVAGGLRGGYGSQWQIGERYPCPANGALGLMRKRRL